MAEIKLYFDNYRDELEQDVKVKRVTAYEQSLLTAMFVGSMLSGSKIPTMEEIYPEMFPKQPEDEKKEMAFLKDQFTAYVERINAQRHKQRQESDK